MIPQLNENSYQNLESRFLQIFPHRWQAIEKPEFGNWITIPKRLISDASLLAAWEDPTKYIGLRFGEFTSYAMLDIDSGSPYHPLNGGYPSQITQALEAIGIVRSVAIVSSSSGGLHIYLPLPQSVKTFKLACLIRQTLEEAGFKIKGGWLEIFPNVKAWGRFTPTAYNGHRLPLQKGSYLVDPESFTYTSKSREDFIKQWDLAANYQDFELLQKKLKKAKNNRYNQPVLYSGDTTKWRQELENIIKKGFTGKGCTNDILHYCVQLGAVFLGKVGESLTQWMFDTIRSMPNFEEFCGHKHELYKRCVATVRWNERHQAYTPYCSHPERENITQKIKELKTSLNLVNEDRKTSAQERIKNAVESLKGIQWPNKISLMRAILDKIQEKFSVRPSMDTLYKNAEIWEPLLSPVTPEPEEITDNSSPIPPPDEPPQTQIQQAVPDPPLYEGVDRNLKNFNQISYPAPQTDLSHLPPLPISEPKRRPSPQERAAKALELARKLQAKFTAGNSESQPKPEPESLPEQLPEQLPEPEQSPTANPESSAESLASPVVGSKVKHRLFHWYGQVHKVAEDFLWVNWSGNYGALKTEAWLCEFVE